CEENVSNIATWYRCVPGRESLIGYTRNQGPAPQVHSSGSWLGGVDVERTKPNRQALSNRAGGRSDHLCGSRLRRWISCDTTCQSRRASTGPTELDRCTSGHGADRQPGSQNPEPIPVRHRQL